MRNWKIFSYTKLFLLLGSVLLLLFCSCGAKPEDEIAETLDKREQGMEKKDLELYMSAVAKDYNDGEDTQRTIKIKAKRNMDLFDDIDFQVEKRTIYLEDDQAKVVQKYILSFTLPAGRKSAKGEELLTLREGKDGWKIVGGL